MLWLLTGEVVDERILVPLRRSVDFAFVLYLIVLVARPLQQLLRKDWTAALLRNRRLIGVAFAAAMTVHLALIAYRFGTQPELEYPIPSLLFGGTTYSVFYLMLITSFDGPKKALGPKAWKRLHRLGLVLGGVVFGLVRWLESLTDPSQLVFAVPFAIAVLIRATAWQRSRRRGS